jgi:hypothetical protein
MLPTPQVPGSGNDHAIGKLRRVVEVAIVQIDVSPLRLEILLKRLVKLPQVLIRGERRPPKSLTGDPCSVTPPPQFGTDKRVVRAD